ncbi:MAG: P-loop NTPase [Candidatus Zixiibacteriota bacterium]
MNNNEDIKKNLAGIDRKILVLSGKGGVGKSTVSVNLARALASLGKKVGILDVDIHGPNIPLMLGLEGERLGVTEGNRLVPVKIGENLHVISVAFLLESPEQAVIWRGPLKYNMIKRFLEETQWGELDFLIIDSPPGTGDEPLSVGQMIDDSEAIIVTTPQDVSILDSKKALTFAKTLNLEIAGVVENMSGYVCPHCGETIDLFKTGGGEKAAKEKKVNFLGKVPIDPRVVTAGDEGTTIMDEQSPATKAFKDIAQNIIDLKK